MSDTPAGPFQIPLYLFGPSEVGKTSLLLSLTHGRIGEPLSFQVRGETFELRLQENLHGYYNELSKPWKLGQPSHTKSDQPCGFTASRARGGPPIYFSVHDYDGSKSEPLKRRPKKQPRGDNRARVLVFVIDDRHISKDGSEAENVEPKSEWYATRLRDYLTANPGIHHPPIALLVNKVDKILGQDSDAVGVLRSRPYLLEPSVDRQVIELGAPPSRGLPADSFGRLLQSAMEDTFIARDAALQRFVWTLLPLQRGFPDGG